MAEFSILLYLASQEACIFHAIIKSDSLALLQKAVYLMAGILSQIGEEDLALAGGCKRYFGRGGALGCFSNCSVLATMSSACV